MNKRILIVACMMLLMAVGLFAKQAQSLNTFESSPNPMDRATTIYLNFENPVSVSITIENLAGDTLRTIFSGTCDKNASFLWERDDEEGNYVPNGTYFVNVSYQGRYTSTKKTLILK
jgi:flagellar hook assembly protein FlgD